MRLTQDRRLENPSRRHNSSTRTYCPSALSSWPCRRHHPVNANESRLPCREHRFPATRASARDAATFYLGHTPRLLRLKYLSDQLRRRRTNPGSKSPSCVSHRLRQTNHVAIPSYREESPWHERRFRTAIVSRSQRLRISGDRTWKHPLTHPRKSFAAWQRLSSSLPASPHGPLHG